MAFDPERLLSEPPIETIAEHDVRDVILYALGVGVGIDNPTSAETLRFIYEKDVQVLPTMAAVLANPGFWAKHPRYGLDWKRILHGEQSLTLHRPLPDEGKLLSRIVIEDIYDKGADKGAVMYSRREIYNYRSGDHLATERKAAFLRGDGGKGGRTDAAPPPYPVPDKAFDLEIPLPTRQDQALIYRLSGDYNPLHIDPDIARQARFDRPILHGLCTYGVAGRALLTGLAGGDASRLTSMSCRFSSPVYPGETIVTEIWKVAAGQAAFQSRVAERDVVVLSNGRAAYTEV
jgi:acyl dehydratase